MNEGFWHFDELFGVSLIRSSLQITGLTNDSVSLGRIWVRSLPTILNSTIGIHTGRKRPNYFELKALALTNINYQLNGFSVRSRIKTIFSSFIFSEIGFEITQV